MIKKYVILLSFFAITNLFFTSSNGMIAEDTLENVISYCDFIGLVEVQDVSENTAHAKVVEVWKGNETNEIDFSISPLFVCDISDAVKGETAVVFLDYDEKDSEMVIAHFGRGRMPVNLLNGKQYATIWSDIILPVGTKTIEGHEGYKFIRSVEVSVLKSIVKKSVSVFIYPSLILGIISFVFSFTLFTGKIKINSIYGFRFKKTMESEENLGKVNKYWAKQLLIWSVFLIGISLIPKYGILKYTNVRHFIGIISCIIMVISVYLKTYSYTSILNPVLNQEHSEFSLLNKIEKQYSVKRPWWIALLVTIIVLISIYIIFISTKSFEGQYLMSSQMYKLNPSLVYDFQLNVAMYKRWTYSAIACSIIFFVIAVGLWRMKKWGVFLYEIFLFPGIMLLIISSRAKILRIILKEGVFVFGNTVYIILALCLIAIGIAFINLWRKGKFT